MQDQGIARLFTGLSRRYDLINRTLSLGLDPMWRRKMVRRSGSGPETSALDVCTGTGDLAIGLARSGAERVVGIDLSEGMLAAGRKKVEDRGLGNAVFLRRGDALQMPFPDSSFDVVCVAFGLRNLQDRRGGVAEMVRVLRPGGKLLILEFSPPSQGIVGSLSRIYISTIVPLVGGLLSGDPAAYRYLRSSITGFLAPAEVCRLLTEAGLCRVRHLPLTGGIVALHTARK